MPVMHDPRWKELTRLKYLNARREGQRVSPKALEIEFSQVGEDDYPKERTIREWMREADLLQEQEQEPYLYVRWPESFEAGLLPWESAAAILRLRGELGQFTVRRGRWHWRVVQAAPEARFYVQTRASAVLASYEAAGGVPSDEARSIEMYFALRGWEDDEPHTPEENYQPYRERLATFDNAPAPWLPNAGARISGDTPDEVGARMLLEEGIPYELALSLMQDRASIRKEATDDASDVAP